METRIDTLVNLFEKISTSKDRKSFLKSFAQDITTNQDFFDARKLLQLAKDLLTPSVRSILGQSFQSQLQLISSSPIDINWLKQQLDAMTEIQDFLFKRSQNSNDPKEQMLNQRALDMNRFISKAKENYAKLGAMSASPAQLQSNENKWLANQLADEVSEKDVASHAWEGPAPTNIDPKAQEGLNKLLGLKLVPDGKLGPQTATALTMFKNKFNSPKHIYDQSLAQDVIFAASGEWEKQFGKELEYI